MQMYGYSSPLQGFGKFITGRSVLARLMVINIAVFLLINLVSLGMWLFRMSTAEGHQNILVNWMAVPASLPMLMIKPWTLFTYMFTQENFFHLFFNMIVLYFGGQLFVQFLGSRRMLFTYIAGGLMGAAFYIAAYNIFTVFHDAVQDSLALGSSAAVLAILVAAATYYPNHSVMLFLLSIPNLFWLINILPVNDL